MATVTFKGDPVSTVGDLPSVGEPAPDFILVKSDLSEAKLEDYAGSRLLLNIFPSLDTGTCAQSVRTFNQRVAELDNTKVLCVSADLPFAAARFCSAEGIENAESGSSFRSSFGKAYGVTFASGPLSGLLSRSVVIIDEEGNVMYTQQVAETADEPDYDAAIEALS